MVPVCSSVMLELVLTVHSYHVIAYPVDSDIMPPADKFVMMEIKVKSPVH